MSKTLRTKSSNNRIVILLMILGLSILLMSGCQQASTPSNSNTATNSNATANTNANSNANTAQTFKNDLLGTWIGVDDPKKKVTFTADEMTLVEDGKEQKFKYTRLSNDEIEVVHDGTKKKAKTTFEGEVLTITADETVKFKRESANNNANANTSASPSNSAANTNSQASNTAANIATTTKEGVPLTAEEKVFANNLIGAWSDDNERVVFSKDEIKFYDKASNRSGMSWKYTIVDEKNVEITDERGQKSKATMTFENNNTTLKWKDKMGDFTYKREAAMP